MRSFVALSLIAIVGLSGCLLAAEEPALPSDTKTPQGIAVGEPHPGAGDTFLASECRLEEGPEGERGQIVGGIGNVTWVDLEGGFWGILADNGSKIQPVNLCKEFQQEGLRVRFDGYLRPDLSGIQMWGEYLELASIGKA